MHPFSTTLFCSILEKVQGKTIQFIHKAKPSQSIDNSADKGEKIHNLPFSKTNLTAWQQNGPVHQGDYHLLQSNLLLESGTCQQAFQKCQRFTNAGSNSREEFLFCYRLPVKLLQLCLRFAALLKAPQFCFSSLHS